MRVKVLVVDDSALMRKYIGEILEEAMDAEIATARDGAEALAKVREFNPDVVTLDINMPVMDGITCLSHIMTEQPRPVVMVSSITERDALATFEALHLGAVDYVMKPGGTVSLNIKVAAKEIVNKVRAASRQARIASLRGRPRDDHGASSRARVQPGPRPSGAAPAGKPVKTTTAVKPSAAVRLVMIGVSTGGPSTLEHVLPELPATFPAPVLVAQHMPATFTRVFAARLDSLCNMHVREVDRRTRLEPGHIYIAQGNADVEVTRIGVGLVALTVPEDPELGWHPSVARMVRTASRDLSPAQLVAVMLTGMGDDGAAAMKELHDRGGRAIAESSETAVIFGMPQELIALGGADVVLPSHRIGRQLVEWAGAGRS